MKNFKKLITLMLFFSVIATGCTVNNKEAIEPAPKVEVVEVVNNVIEEEVANTLPTFRGIDHFGYTVPDMEEAAEFFINVLGAEAAYNLGPFADNEGTWMEDHLNVNPRATIPNIMVLSARNGSNIELFEYDSPDKVENLPLNSDNGGSHLGVYVKDIDKAVEYLKQQNIEILGEPILMTEGANAGESWVYFLTPWGMQMELVSSEEGKGYEKETDLRLFDSADTDETYATKGLPGFMGIDHIGITVPNNDEAIEFFVELLGYDKVYELGPFADNEGTWMKDYLNVHPRAVIPKISVLKAGNGSNLEVFEYDAPDQNVEIPKNSDNGGNHIGLYVDDINAAYEFLISKNVKVFGDPKLMTEGSNAGESWVYFLTPWGMQMELVSSPEGKAYENETDVRLFNPSN